MRFFVLSGILFPFVMTTLGAAVVFLFRQHIGVRAQRICLGFAAGVMTAATAFSLLVPASEQMRAAGGAAWFSLAVAFLTGAGVIAALDILLRRVRAQRPGRDALLLWAVVLHNIPEGMAVGVAFAAAGESPAAAAAASAVALGIGLQNIPEGAAIALPLRQSGMTRRRSFWLGALSGAVEPLAAGVVLLFAGALGPVLPGLMAMAAGAMTLVVFSELAPASTAERDGALAVMIGFALMMAMDVGLG